MNKRLTVVAASLIAAATPAFSQSVVAGTNISISGLLAVGVKNSEITQGNSAAAAWATRSNMPSETHVTDNTSRIIFASTSKITEGWNVIFKVESRFTADTRPGDNATVGLGVTVPVANATGWADGDTWGGVSSPYGSIVVGKVTLYYTDSVSVGYLAPSLEGPGEGYRIWDGNGLALFNLLSTYNTGTVTAGVLAPTTKNTLGITRSRNVIQYNSIMYKPTGADLLDFSLAWSKNVAGPEAEFTPGVSLNTSNYAGGSVISGRMRYNGYGFSASASYLDQKFQTPVPLAQNSELKAMRLGVSYKIAGFKAGIVWDNTNSKNGISTAGVFSDAKRSVFCVPLSYSFGDHAVYATYTMADKTSSLVDTGAKQINVGYDYALTKRAFVGIMYTKLDNDANAYYQPFLTGYSLGGSAIAKGESWRQVSLNMNYWF